MSVLEKLARVQAARPQGGNFAKVKGIYHQWKSGPNRIRLAGEFTEVRTHYIAPTNTAKRKDRGLCMPTAFQGDDKLPQVINCPNWDIALERPKKEKTCPICKLNEVARAFLKGVKALTADEKTFFDGLKQSTRATSALKWNVIDRDDPFVEVENNGKAEKVLGYKIASVGPEATTDIMGIFTQVGYDIQDPERGIDIEVTRDDKGQRTTYSARAVIEGTSLKVTPFTKEERALALNDLKARCGRQIAVEKIMDALHEDLKDIATSYGETPAVGGETDIDAAVDEAVAEVSEPVAAPSRPVRPVVAQVAPQTRPAAPAASKVPTSVLDRLQKKPVAHAPATDEDDALAAVISGDEDGIMDAPGVKKK